jgi:hypothetical protein
MLLTEEEAKTKWCPNARESGGDTGTFWNKPRKLIAKLFGIDYAEQEATDRGCLCIASACMAWRWAEEKNAEAVAEFEALCPTGASMGCEVTGPSPVGYCGIAGRPE